MKSKIYISSFIIFFAFTITNANAFEEFNYSLNQIFDDKPILIPPKKDKKSAIITGPDIKLGYGTDFNLFSIVNFSAGTNIDFFNLNLAYRYGWKINNDFTLHDLNFSTYTLNAGIIYQNDLLCISANAGAGYISGSLYTDDQLKQFSSHEGLIEEAPNKVSTLCTPVRLELGIQFGIFAITGSYEYILYFDKNSIDNIGINLCLRF